MSLRLLLSAIALCGAVLLQPMTSEAVAKGKSSKTAARKNTVHKPGLTPGQYPESSERLLTERDLEHLSPWGLKVIENEIYARNGYVFRDAALRKHFRKEKWYRGTRRTMSGLRLNANEQQNLAFIRSYRQGRH